jgi:hypothetical protein
VSGGDVGHFGKNDAKGNDPFAAFLWESEPELMGYCAKWQADGQTPSEQ